MTLQVASQALELLDGLDDLSSELRSQLMLVEDFLYHGCYLLLRIGSKCCFEFGAGAVDEGLDRAERNVEKVGDLFVREAVEVEHG